MKKPIVVLMLCCFTSTVWASDAKLENIQVDTSVPAVERGADTLMNYCHSCHSLKYIKYRDLAAFGIDKKKIEDWRGGQPLDAPLAGLMPDDAAMQSFGKIPPDLSLVTKAREGGASYVYSYLLGYYNTPEGITVNHIFPETKMPDVLGISGTTKPAQRDELQGKARDIVSFLAWAADPHEEERHRLGYYVIGYLVILTLLLYIVKNQIWSGLK
jgi:ubiquinol-cytochrome c reductase cytochrome c1 subunit